MSSRWRAVAASAPFSLLARSFLFLAFVAFLCSFSACLCGALSSLSRSSHSASPSHPLQLSPSHWPQGAPPPFSSPPCGLRHLPSVSSGSLLPCASTLVRGDEVSNEAISPLGFSPQPSQSLLPCSAPGLFHSLNATSLRPPSDLSADSFVSPGFQLPFLLSPLSSRFRFASPVAPLWAPSPSFASLSSSYYSSLFFLASAASPPPVTLHSPLASSFASSSSHPRGLLAAVAPWFSPGPAPSPPSFLTSLKAFSPASAAPPLPASPSAFLSLPSSSSAVSPPVSAPSPPPLCREPSTPVCESHSSPPSSRRPAFASPRAQPFRARAAGRADRGGGHQVKSRAPFASLSGQRPAAGVPSLRMRGWGRNSEYAWEEEDETLKVYVAVEPEATSRDVDCVIGPRSLFLKLRNRKMPLVDGTLKGRVSVENSYWCIESINARNKLPQCMTPAADSSQLHSHASHAAHSHASPPPPPSPAPASASSSASPSARLPSDEEIAKAPWLGLDLVEHPPPPSPAAADTGKLLTVYLQKKPLSGTGLGGPASGGGAAPLPEWGGVLEGEEVDDIFYDVLPSKMRDLTPAHRAQEWVPGVLLYRQAFPASFTRQEALQFIDAWTRARSAVGADAIAASPSLTSASLDPSASPSLLAKTQAVLTPAADPSANFGLPATQMFIVASPLADGVRLSFEGPPAPRTPRGAARAAAPSPRVSAVFSAPLATQHDDGKAAVSASAPDARSSSLGESLSAATASQLLQGEGRAARYDEDGHWMPEDSIDIRVIGRGAEEDELRGACDGEREADAERLDARLREKITRDSFALELVVLRGPVGSGGKGQFGPLLSLQVRDTEERLLKKLQQDLLGVTLAMREKLHARDMEKKEMEDDLFGPPKDLCHDSLAREINATQDGSTSSSSASATPTASPESPSPAAGPGDSPSASAVLSPSSASDTSAPLDRWAASAPSVAAAPPAADAVDVDTDEITPEWIEKFPALKASIEEERDWLAKFPLQTKDGTRLVPSARAEDAELSGSNDDAMRRRRGSEADRERARAARKRTHEQRNPYGIKVIDLDDKSGHKTPEFMQNWSPERRREFQREVVHDLEQNIRRCQETKEVLSMAEVTRHLQTFLNFSDAEIQDIWRAGHTEASRFINDPRRDLENLKKNQEKRKTAWAQHELFFPVGEKHTDHDDDAETEKVDVFDLMAGPGPDVAPPHTMGFKVMQTDYDQPLHQRWEAMSEREQLELRVKLREKEARLDMLVYELMEATDEGVFPVICDQYKDLLMDEQFLLLMKLHIRERPPRTRKEKDILVVINKFVVSLYEDVEALAVQNEKEQLEKIRLLCMQALVDVEKLTEYAESMKQLLNRDFLAYLEFAIHAERKRIQKEGNNPDAAPSRWLMVLMIIHKGVMAIYEKEIWEDVLWITMVVTQKPPEVRRKLLELFVAQIPKADWKQFKRVALRMADALAKGGDSHSPLSFPSCPWVPEAVAQLARDLERILPDWMIEGMMTDFDKQVLKQKMDRMSFLWGEKDLESLRNVNVTLPNVSEMMKEQIERATEVFNKPQELTERGVHAIT
ncbi:hypothetical protein BESB_025660 [Besnoitia besnoiti]|uniref:CS domain-containing protein n=1 Tax=Besnoitia besnoiti TaxID=94643 RepID=A0A2A9M875_BESBE|nr:uncharacterized protein BESB_025660 [Besnoitia besnoiti]PFH31592.1 hypothetical protein BESB_025660 [Besnoitia besnoiti]